jgi:hypothetical protein
MAGNLKLNCDLKAVNGVSSNTAASVDPLEDACKDNTILYICQAYLISLLALKPGSLERSHSKGRPPGPPNPAYRTLIHRRKHSDTNRNPPCYVGISLTDRHFVPCQIYVGEWIRLRIRVRHWTERIGRRGS